MLKIYCIGIGAEIYQLTTAIPKSISNCVLIYSAGSDYVTCFSCGVKLSDFTRNESVWTRHARISPQCTFVRHQKGQDFVDTVLENFGLYTPPTKEFKINVSSTNIHILPWNNTMIVSVTE